jgi:hypothetical protein
VLTPLVEIPRQHATGIAPVLVLSHIQKNHHCDKARKYRSLGYSTPLSGYAFLLCAGCHPNTALNSKYDRKTLENHSRERREKIESW